MGKNIVMGIYGLTKEFPKEESFGLTSQIRRAALSVPANIAEGFGRYHYLDKAKFYLNARGSLYELKSHLLIAQELGYLRKETYGNLMATHSDSPDHQQSPNHHRSLQTSPNRHQSQPITMNHHQSQSVTNLFTTIDTLGVKLNNLVSATRKLNKESQ